jgi:hypothetical protein
MSDRPISTGVAVTKTNLPARIEQFQSAGVHGESPGDVGCRRAFLEHPYSHTAECEFAGQHQPGWPSADHYHIRCVHEAGW